VKFVLTEGEKFIIFAFRDFVRINSILVNSKYMYIGLECPSRVWSHIEFDIDSLQIRVSANRRNRVQPLLQIQQIAREGKIIS
jgi:hypothetical protein